MTAKIFKLRQVGIDLTELRELVELRNEYVHSCSIYAGYSVGITRTGRLRHTLRPVEPRISYHAEYLLPLAPPRLRRIAKKLVQIVGPFVDRTGWQSSWKLIVRKIRKLPRDPEPGYSQLNLDNPEVCMKIVDELNERYVGRGLRVLLGRTGR